MKKVISHNLVVCSAQRWRPAPSAQLCPDYCSQLQLQHLQTQSQGSNDSRHAGQGRARVPAHRTCSRRARGQARRAHSPQSTASASAPAHSPSPQGTRTQGRRDHPGQSTGSYEAHTRYSFTHCTHILLCTTSTPLLYKSPAAIAFRVPPAPLHSLPSSSSSPPPPPPSPSPSPRLRSSSTVDQVHCSGAQD